ILTDTTLVVGAEGTDSLVSMEVARLTGGAGANSFDVSSWTGTGLVDGRTGVDAIRATNDVDFTLGNTSLARTNHGTLTLANLENATLTGGTSDNVFDVSGWTGGGTLAAGGQVQQDRLVQAGDVDVVLTDALLQRTDLPAIAISGFEYAELHGIT